MEIKGTVNDKVVFFAVGVRTSTGETITGCNVENACGPTVCAERAAICKASSERFRTFTATAFVAYREDSFTSPCGVCRQTLSEFAATDIPVDIAKPVANRVFQLLPFRFLYDKMKKLFS